MRANTKRIIAASLAAAIGVGGAKAVQEKVVKHGIEDGKAIVVAAPAGSCALRKVEVEGDSTFIDVAVTSQHRQIPNPSGLTVLTGRGKVEVKDAYHTGKGAPGFSTFGGTIHTSDVLSPAPINPLTPGGTVVVQTPEGSAVCGAFAIVPGAGNNSRHS